MAFSYAHTASALSRGLDHVLCRAISRFPCDIKRALTHQLVIAGEQQKRRKKKSKGTRSFCAEEELAESNLQMMATSHSLTRMLFVCGALSIMWSAAGE